MKTYYIGFYTSDGKDKIKGNWKTSDAEVKEEANSTLYKRDLGYTLTATGSITEEKAQELATQHSITVADVLANIS